MSAVVPFALWLATVVGIAAPAFVAGFFYAKRGSAHVHEWGQWKPFGITYQERTCTTCGLRKIKDR